MKSIEKVSVVLSVTAFDNVNARLSVSVSVPENVIVNVGVIECVAVATTEAVSVG